MPFIGPSAAFFIAALISSFVAAFFSTATRSTSDPVGVGTLTDRPYSLPLSSGITLPTAFAAPVVVGICDRAADLARRRSLWGRSSILWSLVYECMVVMNPISMPKLSFRTFATGARQFVVHEALDMHWCSGLSILSFKPTTIIASMASFAGTVRITFFAPFFRWSPYPPLGL